MAVSRTVPPSAGQGGGLILEGGVVIRFADRPVVALNAGSVDDDLASWIDRAESLALPKTEEDLLSTVRSFQEKAEKTA